MEFYTKRLYWRFGDEPSDAYLLNIWYEHMLEWEDRNLMDQFSGISYDFLLDEDGFVKLTHSVARMYSVDFDRRLRIKLLEFMCNNNIDSQEMEDEMNRFKKSRISFKQIEDEYHLYKDRIEMLIK